MKHLDNWKLFESKFTDLLAELDKTDPKSSDSLIEPLIPIIFIHQLNKWLKQKLSKPGYRKHIESRKEKISFKILPSLLHDSDSCYKFIGIYFNYAKSIIIPHYHTSEPVKLVQGHFEINRKKILDAISPDEKWLFKENIFEVISERLVLQETETILNLFEKKISKSESIPSNKQLSLYFSWAIKNRPDLIKKISDNLNPNRLNWIRTNIPILFDAIKSLQSQNNQWSTDLQADAGEYGL